MSELKIGDVIEYTNVDDTVELLEVCAAKGGRCAGCVGYRVGDVCWRLPSCQGVIFKEVASDSPVQ